MKRTLLVLALLVTTELGFQTAEACPVFYYIFTSLAFGRRTLLNTSLNKVNATDAEKAAFGKIQDCYNEGGIKAKLLDAKGMLAITTSEDCKDVYTEELIRKLIAYFPSFPSINP